MKKPFAIPPLLYGVPLILVWDAGSANKTKSLEEALNSAIGDKGAR